jgi:hypothetical protein
MQPRISPEALLRASLVAAPRARSSR